MQELMELEETVVLTTHLISPGPLLKGTSYEQFEDDLDIAKSESAMTKSEQFPIPQYIKNYINLSLQSKKTSKDNLVVRFTEKGLKLVSSFFENSTLEPVLANAVPVRSESTPTGLSSLRFSESSDTGNFIYQIIPENEEQAYLYIKLNTTNHGFDNVNVRKNDRFIFSKNIGPEGDISFSGLAEGQYNIEFTGKNISKSIDLNVISG
jgi:hypothetical protein